MSELKQVEPALIFSLIPKIMAEVGAIEKSKKNAQQGYKFRGIDDVFAAFQPVLAKHGVFYVPDVLNAITTDRVTKAGSSLIYTNLTVAYTFFAPDGSSVRSVVVGEAMDMADKSSNKAMSAALKYALLQIFCVPTEAMEDADAETHDNSHRREASAQQQQQQRQSQQGRQQERATLRAVKNEGSSDRPTKSEPEGQAAETGEGEKGFNCPLGLVDAYNKAAASLDAAGVGKNEWRAKVREVLEMSPEAHLDMRDLEGPQMSKAVNAMNALAKEAKLKSAGAR
jgi:hypothetical protein